eukprot:Opistho-1_new@77103
MNALRQNIEFLKQIGWSRGFWLLMREGDLRAGTLVGEDKFGNKYYEDKNRILGRNRWVEYKPWKAYDASQIPAEWHRWIHYISDHPPVADPRMNYHPSWAAPYTQNLTGTTAEYVPYSTTRPKIEEWIPPKSA